MAIKDSELIINPDGSVFHLHLHPQQLSDKIILVGDPARVDTVASNFDDIECDISNREFHTITGSFNGKRITVTSTGIGCDNIDIVLNELDSLVNIDFSSRTVKKELKQLQICRIGTCGGVQDFTPEGTFIASVKSIGLDGLLNFYANRDQVCDQDVEHAFIKHMGWKNKQCIPHPYVVSASETLLNKIGFDMIHGITIACGGFYGPQGRKLRLEIADPQMIEKIQDFNYEDLKITNFEMESSALAGLAKLMGHQALTCCMVVANRVKGIANTNYRNTIQTLIKTVLERI